MIFSSINAVCNFGLGVTCLISLHYAEEICLNKSQSCDTGQSAEAKHF